MGPPALFPPADVHSKSLAPHVFSLKEMLPFEELVTQNDTQNDMSEKKQFFFMCLHVFFVHVKNHSPQDQAATKIQSRFRGKQARLEADRRREAFKTGSRSATRPVLKRQVVASFGHAAFCVVVWKMSCFVAHFWLKLHFDRVLIELLSGLHRYCRVSNCFRK